MSPPETNVPLSRRRVLARVLLRGTGMVAGGLWGYSGLIEPNLPRLEQRMLSLPRLPHSFDGVRVAFLSDIHLQPGFGPERLGPALAHLRAAKPDLIVFGGDYCNDTRPDRERWLEVCADALRGLSAPLGVFAIFGNHDYPVPPFDPPRRPWHEAGITPLHDEVIECKRGNELLYLVGLRSTLMRGHRLLDAVAKLPRTAPKLIAQHEPAYVPENAALGGILMLSGHTHGGQIVLPGGYAPVLPPFSNGYRAGVYYREAAQMPLYVTRGVGVLPPLLRFACPPEVTILTLRSATD